LKKLIRVTDVSVAMFLNVNWCQAGNSALRALSTLLIPIILSCLALLPFETCHCFNLKRQQRFSDYDDEAHPENESEQQEAQQDGTMQSSSLLSNKNVSTELLPYPKTSSHGIVEAILNNENVTDSTAKGDRAKNSVSVNPANVPAPIDYSKPYMIKCDSRGSCYASPLNDDEVPPLPSYNKALTCSTHPL
uniref:Secreted protein n=1 Tax=Gongylonema pulchrum TaxID=637853 RepID=A0A183E0D0_9BILA